MMSAVEFSSEVTAAISEAFRGESVREARRILNPIRGDRVLRAVLALSAGDLDRLRHFTEVAESEPRDVLRWAETPLRPGEPDSYEELRDRLKLPPG